LKKFGDIDLFAKNMLIQGPKSIENKSGIEEIISLKLRMELKIPKTKGQVEKCAKLRASF
jgi:hypothetical protein